MIVDVPPSALPAWHVWVSLRAKRCGSVAYAQSNSVPKPNPKLVVLSTRGSPWTEPPASITATLTDALAERRLARTRPAVPPPTMTKSKVWLKVVLVGGEAVAYDRAVQSSSSRSGDQEADVYADILADAWSVVEDQCDLGRGSRCSDAKYLF